jgi:protein-L-isoaspartate(D-aspartate) O-methyltransferase
VLPEAFLQQLKVGGRIAAIVGEAPAMNRLNIITRTSERQYDTVKVFETNVKPCRGAPSRRTSRSEDAHADT